MTELISLRSVNVADHYLRHHNFLGELTVVSSELDREDATFVVGGLLRPGLVTVLRSKNISDHVLRHEAFRIKLHKYNPGLVPGPGSGIPPAPESPQLAQVRKDATFVVRPGLSDAAGFSFESTNFPGRYLRHRDLHLFLEPADTDLARRDATFLSRPALAPYPPVV